MSSHFDDNKNQRNYKDSVIISRLFAFARPKIGYFIIAIIFSIIIVLLEVMAPLLIGMITELLSESELPRDDLMKEIIKYLSLLFVGSIIIASMLNYICSMLLQKTGQSIVYDIRNKLFLHVEGLSIAQINAQPVGKLVTRITNDTNTLSEFFSNVVVNLLRQIITLIVTFSIMITLSLKLGLIMTMVFPVIVFVTFLFKKVSRRTYREVRGNISNMNAFLAENLSGMKVTQIFNQEEKKLKEFIDKNKKLQKSSYKEIIVFGIFRPLIFLLFISTQMLILYFGTNLVISSVISLTAFIAFFNYIQTFFNPIQQLADQFNQLQSSFASSERIFAILDNEPKILDIKDPIELDNIEGKIEFKNVWFAYNDENWILRDVSFTVNPKETCAFVGATGAGKTTILALIVRNYEIQKGEILIDGININDVSIKSLRKNVGQMLQDVFLFSGTIKDNITLRDDSFTMEEIKEACAYVNANSFVDKLPDNYNYEVKERGNNFSSGQRQLLSFARTIIHKPNIMILDEATSNIDVETEKLIQDSLEKMMNIGTMLIVAHRLSTVQHCDKIVVLHKGQVIEIGNHQELLQKKGMYYNLYELQYKESA